MNGVDRGGFVGIYFMPFLKADGHPTAADVVAHIEHAWQVCGEDHVGIGADGSVTDIDDLEAYKGALAREVAARQKAGFDGSPACCAPAAIARPRSKRSWAGTS